MYAGRAAVSALVIVDSDRPFGEINEIGEIS
jgi:hypothetical protein